MIKIRKMQKIKETKTRNSAKMNTISFLQIIAQTFGTSQKVDLPPVSLQNIWYHTPVSRDYLKLHKTFGTWK
jgi:hypothetical protein